MKRAILAASFTAFLLILTTWIGVTVPDSAAKAGVMAILGSACVIGIIATYFTIGAIED